ncbi:alpha/beta fold hydrolase [Georgenia satyanarayanai]|uniref:alpha/beta fold hydrolase n=1 Tax=Georgenia satyanarayanai TaxID=860221 RepID=UPI00203F1654|nr:alpha/beta fold hydrolase [Georgenia satyanarayanai]MCM3662481.1 alpha/beta fold hydrolase [Georgenia satyanarayanai]
MERRVRRGRLTFDVRDEGSGPPVLLLHGFPQDSTSWRHVVPRLHAAGLRTITMDQRGYSPGARPAARAAYRLELLVADVVAVLDDAGVDRAHVVGHDWGGGAAWMAGSRHPDRVASLTVVSTPHPAALTASLLRSDQALRSSYMAFFQLPGLPERVLRTRLERMLVSAGLPAEQARHYQERMREPGAARGALNWYRGVPLSREGAGRVGVPTTYVWGEADPYLGRRAAELTSDYVYGDYEFLPLPGGHWLPELSPDAVADAVVRRVASAS